MTPLLLLFDHGSTSCSRLMLEKHSRVMANAMTLPMDLHAVKSEVMMPSAALIDCTPDG